MTKHRKNRLKETLSIKGAIAVLIIVASAVFCFVRTVFFSVNIWDILDSAVVNVVCSAAIFLIFDIKDVRCMLRLSKIVDIKMKKSIKDWEMAIRIVNGDVDKRLCELNELDMAKPQPDGIVYAINGEVENPPYYDVLYTETNKLITKMKEFQDVYFDFLDPEVATLINKILNSWECSKVLFNTTKNRNKVIISDGGKHQEKYIVFGIRQIAKEVETINKMLNS